MGFIFEDRDNFSILDEATKHFNLKILPVLEQEFSMHENNTDILFHSVKAGKRLRPYYCYLAHQLADGENEDSVNHAAAAMELIHCSSLLIDDELDAKELRPDRNVETVRTRFSPQESVFMGACLELLYTYNMLVKACKDLNNGRAQEVLLTFSQSYSEGVSKEIEKWKHIENKVILTKDDYWNRHIHSSGGLFFRMSGRIGALLATEDKDKVKNLSKIGYVLGQIHQAGDDVKDLKADMAQGYYSLSVIDYLDNLDFSQKAEFRNKLAGSLSEEQVEEIYDKMVESGSIDRTLSEMKIRGEGINKILDEFPDNEGKKNLDGLLDFLATRMRLK